MTIQVSFFANKAFDFMAGNTGDDLFFLRFFLAWVACFGKLLDSKWDREHERREGHAAKGLKSGLECPRFKHIHSVKHKFPSRLTDLC